VIIYILFGVQFASKRIELAGGRGIILLPAAVDPSSTLSLAPVTLGAVS